MKVQDGETVKIVFRPGGCLVEQDAPCREAARASGGVIETSFVELTSESASGSIQPAGPANPVTTLTI